MIPVLSMIVAVVLFMVTVPAWTKERSSKDADLYAVLLFAIDSAAVLVFINSLGAFL